MNLAIRRMLLSVLIQFQYQVVLHERHDCSALAVWAALVGAHTRTVAPFVAYPPPRTPCGAAFQVRCGTCSRLPYSSHSPNIIATAPPKAKIATVVRKERINIVITQISYNNKVNKKLHYSHEPWSEKTTKIIWLKMYYLKGSTFRRTYSHGAQE